MFSCKIRTTHTIYFVFCHDFTVTLFFHKFTISTITIAIGTKVDSWSVLVGCTKDDITVTPPPRDKTALPRGVFCFFV